MELRLLQYFLAIVREENITRAAEALHVTQPTLSRQMNQLEEELGVKLFVRGRRLTLTDAGIMLRRRAEEVVSMVDRIEAEFEEQEEMGGIISIGAGGLTSFRVLPGIMARFRERYPKVQFDLYTNSAEYARERLDQGFLDFALLMEPIDVSKYDYLRMEDKERWGVMVKKDHPLVKKGRVEKKDLDGMPLCVPGRLSMQKELAAWLGGDLSRLNIFATQNISINTLPFINEGIAGSLCVEGAINRLQSENIVFVPLDPPLEMTTVLAWKKFMPTYGAAWRFLEFFKKEISA